ncbi:hypothetical protein L21SP2_1560 [Salinispira pacifica]|uniref:Uncharacterized protein n=1 Tax=Salinispira pacifica TaxID=1307761 RepID=V5WHB7_9SPIO|nr:hypothetical protein L21SP2_1560 [Salinispira pacifica]
MISLPAASPSDLIFPSRDAHAESNTIARRVAAININFLPFSIFRIAVLLIFAASLW